jgi:multisubunit Na+/H+ antiporter MnhB subunit
MTEILNVTGGVLGAITGIGMLVAYERARMSAELPKNSLRVPQIVVGLTFCVFFAVLVSSLWG